MRKIIFDLDLTLIDTTCLEEYRNTKNWQQAYNMIPQTSMYLGIQEVFEIIKKHNIITAIVTTTPRPYAEKLIDYYTNYYWVYYFCKCLIFCNPLMQRIGVFMRLN